MTAARYRRRPPIFKTIKPRKGTGQKTRKQHDKQRI